MNNHLLKPPTIDLNAFAEDFATYMAKRQGRKASKVELIVVPDDRWDQLLAVTAPYRGDPNNHDRRVGMAFAVREPLTENEVPDLIKTLFPELGDAMQTADLIICFNQQTLTHPQETTPERAFNALFIHLVILTEKALEFHGYKNLNPITDSQAFSESPYFQPDRYIRSSGPAAALLPLSRN